MNSSRALRLFFTGKFISHQNVIRKYSNRNILKLHERGIINDFFPSSQAKEITDLLNYSPQCVYAGFDPTAESLHVGNLLILINLLHWQRAGHQVIALLGGATSLLGDPSHRKEERVLLEVSEIDKNANSIQKNIEKIFKNHETYLWQQEDALKPLKFVNNIDWYRDIKLLDYIHSLGQYFRVGTMLGRSSVQARLNSQTGMSFAELNYQVFQAYDWLQLYKNHDCRFQIGGIDQMGNIVSGYELISKCLNKTVYGITSPLITTDTGKKFGKSSGNCVWLSSNNTSSFKLYQFFLRTPDSKVEQYLKYFTFCPIPQIKQIVDNHFKRPEKLEAQRILAEQVTLLVHGEKGLNEAEKISEVLYSKDISAISSLKSNEISEIFDGANVVNVLPEQGMTVFELAKKMNCFTSENEALRVISVGGLHINHQKITNINEIITKGIHVLPNNISLVRVGKKNYHIVKWI